MSVVVPHYGDPEPTRRLVRLLAGEEAYETIVVDDCSPTPLPPLDGARILRRRSNGGFGSAVNTGAAAATGELLLVLNSDLEITPGFVAQLVAAAAPWQPSVCSPRVIDSSGLEQWTGRHFPTVSHQIIEWLTPLARWRDRPRMHEAVGHDTAARGADSPQRTDWVVGAAMLIPLGPFRDVGGFDESFYMNAEEVDLQRRLRDIGVGAMVLPSPVVVHDGGGSSPSPLRRRWLVAARLRYAEKWASRPALAAGLTAASMVNLAWNSLRALRHPSVRPWATARGEWNDIWQRRSSSQAPDARSLD